MPRTAPILFYSNKEVDKANIKRLNDLDTECIYSVACDSVSGTGPKKTKRDLLMRAQKLTRDKTANLEYKIAFKIGARYMLTTNVDTMDGLVNGAIGLLRHSEFCSIKGSDSMGVKRVWLEFPDSQPTGSLLFSSGVKKKSI